LLEFQRAKRAFEEELISSGLTYSIVRPTAFFKSLSGQIERVRAGKPFMVFGNGKLTACKPISDDDLGGFIADCLHDDSRWNRILPIGGPGDAITPLQQGEILFAAFGREPKIQSIPVALLKVIQNILRVLGIFSAAMADKAELAGIGLYYATESMLVFNHETGLYDEHATPSTGTQSLADHYARFIKGDIVDDRGDHAVF
jgi:divinyl chlorophyllide a 8-vinyl-reductase